MEIDDDGTRGRRRRQAPFDMVEEISWVLWRQVSENNPARFRAFERWLSMTPEDELKW